VWGRSLAIAAPVGAENRVTSYYLQMLADEAADPVALEHADGGLGTWRCWLRAGSGSGIGAGGGC
jgi:hypothetical protein